jgi:hypothetical protein
VDPTEGPQVGTQCCSCPFAGVAMDLALAITIIIPGPFAYTVANRGMRWMTAPVALPFVGVQPRAASRNGFGDEGAARPRVRVVSHPKALLARVA